MTRDVQYGRRVASGRYDTSIIYTFFLKCCVTLTYCISTSMQRVQNVISVLIIIKIKDLSRTQFSLHGALLAAFVFAVPLDFIVFELVLNKIIKKKTGYGHFPSGFY